MVPQPLQLLVGKKSEAVDLAFEGSSDGLLCRLDLSFAATDGSDAVPSADLFLGRQSESHRFL